jgi:hypothetical protein
LGAWLLPAAVGSKPGLAEENVAISFSILAAASINPIANAAPVPSPSLICKSNKGVSPMSSSSAACPGSDDRWPANMNLLTFGSSVQAATHEAGCD